MEIKATLASVHYLSPCGRFFEGVIHTNEGSFLATGRHHSFHTPTAGCEYLLTGEFDGNIFYAERTRVQQPIGRTGICSLLSSMGVSGSMASLMWATHGRDAFGLIRESPSTAALVAGWQIHRYFKGDHRTNAEIVKMKLERIGDESDFIGPPIPADEPISVEPCEQSVRIVESSLENVGEQIVSAEWRAIERGHRESLQIITHPDAPWLWSAAGVEAETPSPLVSDKIICNRSSTYPASGLRDKSIVKRNEIGRLVDFTSKGQTNWGEYTVAFGDRRVRYAENERFPCSDFGSGYAVPINRIGGKRWDAVIAVIPPDDEKAAREVLGVAGLRE